MRNGLSEAVKAVRDEAVALRHELHQNPEIRFEEAWTSDRIARFLSETGIDHTRGYARGTGIVAEIPGGAGDGPCVALRADMDALEITEQTGLPYASTIAGRMHACGHDGHMAIICGAAKVLHGMRGQLPGSVRIFFQPGEELAAGASYMVDEGVMEGVDAVFGLHGWPGMRCGAVGVKPGPMMASAGDFHIEVIGKGCHAAMAYDGIDPVLTAAAITTALQSIVTREVPAMEPAVLTVAEILGGSATNIIPERASLRGTFRSFSESVDNILRTGIERVAQGVAAAHRARVEVSFGERPYPPTINDGAMTALVRAAAVDCFGEEQVVDIAEPTMGAEDFSYYLRKAPGAYVWLGVNPSESEPYPALHNAKYDFTDDAVPAGIELMAATAVRYLKS
jgi:amidohydrolase